MSLPAPSFEFSLAGQKLTAHTGILELMDDLGRAMTVAPHMRMLGGGNPAAVPGLQALVRERMGELMADGDAFERMMVSYDPPQVNAFSTDGKFLLSAGHDRVLRLWDLQKRKEVRVLKGHTASVRSVAFSPDGKRAVSAGDDRSLRVFDLANGFAPAAFSAM